MTLLERWDHPTERVSNDEIRRAIAIAQAVEDMVAQDGAGKCAHSANAWIMSRADELLRVQSEASPPQGQAARAG